VNANPDVVRDSPKKVMDFIKDNAALRRFYMVELEELLANYEPGRPEMKPDVIAQTLQLEKDRAKMAENAAAAAGGGNIVLEQPGQAPIALNNKQVIDILQNLQSDVASRDKEIMRLNHEYQEMFEKYEALQREHIAVKAALQTQAEAEAETRAPDADAAAVAHGTATTTPDTETIYV
jgi:regulator of replication initiation timing